MPVLGALPQASDYPATMYAVVLAPVLVGVWLGRRVDAELEFFGNVRARLSATAVAALVAVAVVVALTALGNGAVGVDRLSAVGAHLWSFAAALTAEVVGGALLFMGVLVLRDRRAEQRERESGVASEVGPEAETSAPAED